MGKLVIGKMKTGNLHQNCFIKPKQGPTFSKTKISKTKIDISSVFNLPNPRYPFTKFFSDGISSTG
jgi:hypothetical protein